MKFKNIFIFIFVGIIASGSLRVFLTKSSVSFTLRDIKKNKNYSKFLNAKDHDGSLNNTYDGIPKIKINTNRIGASDTSSNIDLISNSQCNVLLLGSSTMAAAALPKSYRLETILRKQNDCNFVNLASDGESLEGTILKYQLLKELKKFQYVFLMSGHIESSIANNPILAKDYEPVLEKSLYSFFKRKLLHSKSISSFIKSLKYSRNLVALKDNKIISKKISNDVSINNHLKKFRTNLIAFKFLVDSRNASLSLITNPYEPKNWTGKIDGSKENKGNTINLFNKEIRDISKEFNISLIDIDYLFNNSKKNLLYDTVHLNTEGANLLANEIKNKINNTKY